MVKIRMLSRAAGALAITGFLTLPAPAQQAPVFDPFEATIPQLEAALSAKQITCRELVQYYLTRMDAFDIAGPKLNSIRMRNPRALAIADSYDKQSAASPRGPLFCIPVAVKDNHDTADMPTTAGSVALEDTIPPADATLVAKLKAAGAIIIAKANLTEFANYLTSGMPAGYSSVAGYVLNPYDPRPVPQPLQNSDGRQAMSPGGSSSGPGVVAAANLAAATVGTETSGSILSPANMNSIVGIKPTVGLISRKGIVPIAASQDTAGPMTRTVTDAAILLGAMTGVDGYDSATAASDGLALTDYTPYLKADGLRGARLGVAKEYWSTLSPEQNAIAQAALSVMREQGATIVHCSIATHAQLSALRSSVLPYEFKRDLNTYLATRGPDSSIKTLADVIAYDNGHAGAALKYGQTLALASQAIDLQAAQRQYLADRETDLKLAKEQGIDAVMVQNNLAALVFPGGGGASIAAKAGYPSIIVPAGYLPSGAPYGITFTAGAYSEPTLVSLAYSYEQASKMRQPPPAAMRVLPVSARIQPKQVVNYASGAPGAVAPGEIVAITGSGLGPPQVAVAAITSNNQIARAAGTARALFNGLPAPVISAQASQIVAIVPYGLAGVKGLASAQLTVEYNGQSSTPVAVAVAPAAPAIFTTKPLGQGTPLVLNSDGTLNSAANPAAKGSRISFHETGEGIPNTLGVDGRLVTAPSQTPAQPVIVAVNKLPVNVVYAGTAPGQAGMMQVNAQLDPNTPSGAVALEIRVGGVSSPAVTIYVQ